MQATKVASRRIGESEITIVQGDITGRDVDAIVNAANSRLQHGGGVAGAIVRKGGSIIQDESNAIGHVPVGSAAMTTGGALKARHVIHAVGPRMGEGDEDAKLRSAMRSVLRLAADKGLQSISVPAISTGIFGFPKERAAGILLSEAVSFLGSGKSGALKNVEFCLFDMDTARLFADTLEG